MTPDLSSEAELQSALDGSYRRQHPLRTLWRFFTPRRKQLGWATFFCVIKGTPVWMLPILTGTIINRLTAAVALHQPGQPFYDAQLASTVTWCTIVLVLLVLQNVPNHTIYAMFLSSAVRHVQLLLRSALVVRLQQLSMRFHDNATHGQLQSKVLRDVEAVEGLARTLVETVLSGGVMVIVPMAIALYKQPSVAVFFFITVPVSALMMRAFRNPLRSKNEQFRREVEQMSGRVSEMLEMMPITRAHAVETTEVDSVQRHLVRIREAGRKVDKVNNLFQSSAWATFQLFNVLCLIFNVWQCTRGTIAIGDVVMFQAFFGLMVGVVQGWLNVMPALATGVESMRSIGEVLESPDIEANEGKAAVKQVIGAIEFDHVTFRYPGVEQPAIVDFNLRVTAGECIALVGESGSGKSTLMNLLLGFRRPTEGRLLIDGVDSSTINYRTFRRFLAVVPQQTVLFSGSVRDNITYGLSHVTDAALQQALQTSNCEEFVAKLPQGLDTPIGSKGGKLSGGQRQRIAIARAILRDPRVIILDEATSALDVHSEFLVQQAINRLISGRTTFIIAHRLSTIRDASRILVMQDGRMIETGTHAELLSRSESAFSKLHALQV